jgi:DNA-binding beta-propeller fold protein YncE
MATNPSGTTVYVCGGAALVPVTVFGLVVHGAIALPDVAQGIALTPDGSTAWVTQQAGTLVPVTLASTTSGRPIRMGGHPSAIVIGAG